MGVKAEKYKEEINIYICEDIKILFWWLLADDQVVNQPARCTAHTYIFMGFRHMMERSGWQIPPPSPLPPPPSGAFTCVLCHMHCNYLSALCVCVCVCCGGCCPLLWTVVTIALETKLTDLSKWCLCQA